MHLLTRNVADSGFAGDQSSVQPGIRPGRHRVHRTLLLWFWVRQAAFQSLGPVIFTFANPSRAGLYIREDGTLSIRPPAPDLDSGFTSGSPGAGSHGNMSSAW